MKTKEGTEPKLSTKTGVATEPALKELFIDGIKDLYWAENHLVKTLPKMQKSAASAELANAIAKHLVETEGQVARLEQVFQHLEEEPLARKCDAMEGLSKEGEGIIESTEAGTATRDVGIILASQKVEHYEIASYGGLVQLAKTLGLDEIASLLAESLEEEKNADHTLTGIAESNINQQASSES